MAARIETITLDNSRYPTALREALSTSLFNCIWTIGSLEILNEKLVALLCSKKCPGDIILRTYDLARALRDSQIPVIGGFHTPMEKECLDLLLRGKQPVVVCPARGIEGMRIPVAWRPPLEDGRLLVLSPFEGKHRRVTADLSERRNRMVAVLANTIVVAHAAPGTKTEELLLELLRQGKRVLVLESSYNRHLAERGLKTVSIELLKAYG
jgi:predicted Rossmann fold nucleotide-binding protein DprA/Smf involved in DNA uptake